MKVKGMPEECFAWVRLAWIGDKEYYGCNVMKDLAFNETQRKGGCTYKSCPFMKLYHDQVRDGSKLREMTPQQKDHYSGNDYYDK